jgi:exodeoxyribonuclease VII small subunit
MAKSKRSAPGERRGRGDASEQHPDGASEPTTFEAALEQLEGTVAKLEEGEMPLEEALELFESGVQLSRHCATTLEAAERRIEILVADRNGDGDPAAVPFEADDTDDTDDTPHLAESED